MTIATINPATGDVLRTFEPLTVTELEGRLALAAASSRSWRVTPPSVRAAVVERAGALLDEHCEAYASLMTLEMGKLVGAARDEARKCAAACRYYAEHGPRFVLDEPVAGAAPADRVIYQPLGTVLAVMPWNFPFWQVIRFAAPALVAGNTGLLKHASNVPQCALALEKLFADAGAPPGVFQSLLVGSDAVAGLVADSRVAAVTLTGSETAGRAVAAAAGRHLKKSVMELGGSDAFIVMRSADIARAAATAVTARTINNGQSCIAAKRFIVDEQVADEFQGRFVAAMAGLRVGDPTDPATHIGPLALPQIVDDLERQVHESVRQGARLLTGGKRLRRPGNYFPPTVLVDPPPTSPAAQEELFGPVATVFRARDLDHAIALANDSPFGLAASAWTTSSADQDRFVRELEVGTVCLNGMVASDPRFPFGGVKRSGYGRELGSVGLREFVNTKTVRVNAAATGAQTE